VAKERSKVLVELPIDIDRGVQGLWFVTCPAIRGLMVAGTDRDEALTAVEGAINELTAAADKAMG